MLLALISTLAQVLVKPDAIRAAWEILQQIVETILNRQQRREENRRRFLIWLSGPFQHEQPEARDVLWNRVRTDDDVIDTLSVVFVVLQEIDPGAAEQWFKLRAEESDEDFNELLGQLSPKGRIAEELTAIDPKEAESLLRQLVGALPDGSEQAFAQFFDKVKRTPTRARDPWPRKRMSAGSKLRDAATRVLGTRIHIRGPRRQ